MLTARSEVSKESLGEEKQCGEGLEEFRILSEVLIAPGVKVLFAEHKASGRQFNLKQFDLGDSTCESAMYELKVMSALHGCGRVVCQCHSFQDKYSLYIVSERIPGGNLRTLLNNVGALREDIIKLYIAQLALILHRVHENAVAHCNLNPECVFFSESVSRISTNLFSRG